MKFKIDFEFSTYWPNLTQDKLNLLETSILNEGLREDLVVWKEENILLDGHQRLSILNRHGISFENQIKYLSFSNRDRAKYWIYMNQAARRGDTPRFFKICRVMEFESIYHEEAKERQIRKPKDSVSKIFTNKDKGKMTECMARDAETSHVLVGQVIYIRDNDKDRFEKFKKQCQKTGEDISIDNQWNKVKAITDAKKKKLELDKEAVNSLGSGKSVQAFKNAMEQSEQIPSIKVQKEVAKKFVENEKKLASGEVKQRTETIKDLVIKEQIEEKLGPKKSKKKTEEEKLAEYVVSRFEEIRQKCSALTGFLSKTFLDLKEREINWVDGPGIAIVQFEMKLLFEELQRWIMAAKIQNKKEEEKCLPEKQNLKAK